MVKLNAVDVNKSLNYYLSVCQRLDIAIPDEMITGIKEDLDTGAMGRRVEYNQ